MNTARTRHAGSGPLVFIRHFRLNNQYFPSNRIDNSSDSGDRANVREFGRHLQ
jgi:hypothetical protein